MVYYRKYRPQLISELDLDSVRNRLETILGSGETPHAFLFSGPKGLGKTSAARIVAKAINCERNARSIKKKGESVTFEPCNECAACISITNGSSVDVIEIDAASNRGIDEMRDLRERIKFSPSILSRKVYIIDEVHMLTTEAFNALLKTLEEPPSHVLFILATTEPWKLPTTITSRTFNVQFEKPTKGELVRSLERIVQKENLDIEEGVLDGVFDLADGAFRDAAKILEELSLASGGKRITQETLEKIFKSSSIEHEVDEILAALVKKDVKKALEEIEKISKGASDFKIVMERVATKLHDSLLALTGAISTNKSINLSTRDIQRLLDLINSAYRNLRGAVLPQLPLELAVIEFCLVDEQEQVKIPETQEQKEIQNVKGDVKKENVKVETGNPDILKDLIDLVNQENKILAGLLRGLRLDSQEKDKITLLAQSKFHLDKLSESKNKSIIESKLSDMIGSPIAIVLKIQDNISNERKTR